jgi:U3 small nucleolar RNA-associated protein 18
MSPVNKKAKREQSEKELEGFLFGDDTEELWNKTGQELDQKLDAKDEQNDQEDDEDDEEGAEEVGYRIMALLLFY